MTEINNYGEKSDNGPKGLLPSGDFLRESYRINIAIAAMQGLLAGGMKNNIKGYVAVRAVEIADDLLNELNKPKDENNN